MGTGHRIDGEFMNVRYILRLLSGDERCNIVSTSVRLRRGANTTRLPFTSQSPGRNGGSKATTVVLDITTHVYGRTHT